MSYLTNFPYGLASNGVPLLGSGIPATAGTYYFVDATNGYDGNDGRSWDTAVKTVAQAYSLVTTNKDDVIVLSTISTHTLSAFLDVTKSRVHFVGDTFGRIYGQGAKIALAGTAVTDIHMVSNSGTRKTFTGIKFIASNTATETTAAVGEGGEYTVYTNCSFEGAKMTTTGYADLLLNSDGGQFINCTFGNTSTPAVGAIIRPNIITTAGGVASGVGSSKDVLFRGCKFLRHHGGTQGAFVNITADADVTRGFIEFEDCSFIAASTGAEPAVAIKLGASLTNSEVILSGSTMGYNVSSIATGTGVISGGTTPETVLIGIQTT